jgi:hypothetical protein
VVDHIPIHIEVATEGCPIRQGAIEPADHKAGSASYLSRLKTWVSMTELNLTTTVMLDPTPHEPQPS